MYLYEFDSDRNEVNAILVAADRLEDLYKQGQLKNNWSLYQLTKWINNYLTQSDSTLTLTDKDVLNMVSSDKNPFKKSIKNIQSGEVIFRGNDEKTPPEPESSEKSTDVVKKMAQKAIK
jgi:hypothetical protein